MNEITTMLISNKLLLKLYAAYYLRQLLTSEIGITREIEFVISKKNVCNEKLISLESEVFVFDCLISFLCYEQKSSYSIAIVRGCWIPMVTFEHLRFRHAIEALIISDNYFIFLYLRINVINKIGHGVGTKNVSIIHLVRLKVKCLRQ